MPNGLSTNHSNKKKKFLAVETTFIIFVFFSITVYVCGHYLRHMEISTITSKGQIDRSIFKRFAGILKDKGDVLKALLKEKEFEKAHDEKRYIQLFKAKKISSC